MFFILEAGELCILSPFEGENGGGGGVHPPNMQRAKY